MRKLVPLATSLLLASVLLTAAMPAQATVVTTVFTRNNAVVPAADSAQATDFFFPNAAGVTIPADAKSWRLTVDKTGLPAGEKYLTIAIEYQRSTGWTLDASNEPNGWVGGANHLDGGGTSFIDYLASEIGSYQTNGDGSRTLLGEFPSHARLHVVFSRGFTSPQIQLQVADDFTLA